MTESGIYPPGLEHSPAAPWNQRDAATGYGVRERIVSHGGYVRLLTTDGEVYATRREAERGLALYRGGIEDAAARAETVLEVVEVAL